MKTNIRKTDWGVFTRDELTERLKFIEITIQDLLNTNVFNDGYKIGLHTALKILWREKPFTPAECRENQKGKK